MDDRRCSRCPRLYDVWGSFWQIPLRVKRQTVPLSLVIVPCPWLDFRLPFLDIMIQPDGCSISPLLPFKPETLCLHLGFLSESRIRFTEKLLNNQYVRILTFGLEDRILIFLFLCSYHIDRRYHISLQVANHLTVTLLVRLPTFLHDERSTLHRPSPRIPWEDSLNLPGILTVFLVSGGICQICQRRGAWTCALQRRWDSASGCILGMVGILHSYPTYSCRFPYSSLCSLLVLPHPSLRSSCLSHNRLLRALSPEWQRDKGSV